MMGRHGLFKHLNIMGPFNLHQYVDKVGIVFLFSYTSILYTSSLHQSVHLPDAVPP